MPKSFHYSLLCSLSALALSACAPMGGRGPEMDGPGGRGMGMAGGSGVPMVQEQIQNQLGDTARELKLTPAQLPLWDIYQEKVGSLMSDLLRIAPYRPANQNALVQIGGKVNTVRNRLTALEDIAEAAGKLYESLDDGQKKIADRRLALTVPPLYSGFASQDSGPGGSGPRGGMRGEGAGGRGGMGGPMGGGMGGMGGPMGRL